MRRKPRGALEIFSLSFLDIVACAFGAVVMLVLISKPDPEPPMEEFTGNAPLALVQTLEANLARVTEQLKSKNEELAAITDQTDALQQRFSAAEQNEAALQSTLTTLDAQRRGLVTAVTEREQAALNAKSRSTERDEEVGGIPVDSDYVIFVVDTSGSMQSIWSKVSDTMIDILSIHPTVKGFQVLNDNGHHLLEGYRGRWINDTTSTRDRVISLFRSWNKASNSRPIEGIEAALRLYATREQSVSIYILGDEYAGSNFARDVDEITRMNTNPATETQYARIHGVAFLNQHTDSAFFTLMREVTRQNRGTLISVPN